MSDYTPTTDEVLDAWVDLTTSGDSRAHLVEAAVEASQRWLAERDAKVRAEALREAADTVLHNAGDPAFEGDRGDYANGYRQGQRDAVRALRRIEKEAGL